MHRQSGDDEEFCLCFPHTSRTVDRSLVGARNVPPAVVRALHAKGGSEALTSSPRSDITTLSLISSNDMCRAHEISLLLIEDLLQNFSSRTLAQIAARNPIFLFGAC